jgi:integrase
LIRELQKQNDKKDGDYIYFCSIDALKKRVNRYLKWNLKVKHTSHDFRHGKVTDLINEGVHLKEVATYVGHSNPATTLRYFDVD